MRKSVLFGALISLMLVLGGCASTNVAVTPEKQITENYLHEENMHGNIYGVYQYFPTVGTGENRSLLIRTNGARVHVIQYSVAAGTAPTDLFYYENVSVSNNGTVVPGNQRNRINLTNSSAKWFSEPTVTDKGDLIDRDLLVGEKREGGQTDAIPHHWILRPNETYLIQGVNRANSDAEQNYKIIWWEELVN